MISIPLILNFEEYDKKVPVKEKVIKTLGKFENMRSGGYDTKVIYRPSVLDKL